MIDEAFASQSPALVALLGFSIGWIASSSAWRLARRYAGVLRGRTHLQVFFDFAKSLPGVSHIVAWEHAKVMRSVRSAIVRDEATSVLSLPLEGCSKEEVLRRMGSRYSPCSLFWDFMTDLACWGATRR